MQGGSPQEGSTTGPSAALCHTGAPSAAVPLQSIGSALTNQGVPSAGLHVRMPAQIQGLWDHCPQELPGCKQGNVNGRLHREAYSVTRFAKLSKKQTAVIR